MGPTTRCKKCGVPYGASKNHTWLSNGTIVFARDHSHRMVLLESDNLDGLFRNLERLVERPLEALVAEAKAKATRDFLQYLTNWRTGWAVHLTAYLPLRKLIADMSRVMGYGEVNPRDISPRFKRAERMTMRVNNIYSLPLLCGDFKGAAELVEGGTSAVDYVMEDRGFYLLTAYKTSNEPVPPEENPVHYTSKPGDIAWTRCSGCGFPLEAGRFTWNLENGVITDPSTGRRLAIFGPAGVDRVFYELEMELGRPVDELAVEAQHLHALTFLGKRDSLQGFHSLRDMLAVRGLGNLVSFVANRDGLELRIENPCLKPILIGMIQAGYEVATGRTVEPLWETTPDGSLLLQLK